MEWETEEELLRAYLVKAGQMLEDAAWLKNYDSKAPANLLLLPFVMNKRELESCLDIGIRALEAKDKDAILIANEFFKGAMKRALLPQTIKLKVRRPALSDADIQEKIKEARLWLTLDDRTEIPEPEIYSTPITLETEKQARKLTLHLESARIFLESRNWLGGLDEKYYQNSMIKDQLRDFIKIGEKALNSNNSLLMELALTHYRSITASVTQKKAIGLHIKSVTDHESEEIKTEKINAMKKSAREILETGIEPPILWNQPAAPKRVEKAGIPFEAPGEEDAFPKDEEKAPPPVAPKRAEKEGTPSEAPIDEKALSKEKEKVPSSKTPPQEKNILFDPKEVGDILRYNELHRYISKIATFNPEEIKECLSAISNPHNQALVSIHTLMEMLPFIQKLENKDQVAFLTQFSIQQITDLVRYALLYETCSKDSVKKMLDIFDALNKEQKLEIYQSLLIPISQHMNDVLPIFFEKIHELSPNFDEMKTLFSGSPKKRFENISLPQVERALAVASMHFTYQMKKLEKQGIHHPAAKELHLALQEVLNSKERWSEKQKKCQDIIEKRSDSVIQNRSIGQWIGVFFSCICLIGLLKAGYDYFSRVQQPGFFKTKEARQVNRLLDSLMNSSEPLSVDSNRTKSSK